MRSNNIKKITVIFLILMFVTYISYSVINSINNNKLTNELNDCVLKLIENANSDTSVPQFIIKENKLNDVRHSFFKKFGSELDWNKFKLFINNNYYNWFEIEIGELKNKKDRTYTDVMITFYYESKRSAHSDHILLSAERIEGAWWILGVNKGGTSVDVYEE